MSDMMFHICGAGCPIWDPFRAFLRTFCDMLESFLYFPLHPSQGRLQWGHEARHQGRTHPRHHGYFSHLRHPWIPHRPQPSHLDRLTPDPHHTTIQTWITPPTTPLTFPTTSTPLGMRRSSVMSIMKPPMLIGGKAHMGLLMMGVIPSEVRQA